MMTTFNSFMKRKKNNIKITHLKSLFRQIFNIFIRKSVFQQLNGIVRRKSFVG